LPAAVVQVWRARRRQPDDAGVRVRRLPADRRTS